VKKTRLQTLLLQMHSLYRYAAALGTSVHSLTIVRGGGGGGWGGGGGVWATDADARALATRMKSVGTSIDAMVGGLYKLNPLDPQLETAWFQILRPMK
jgi:hypothetical protein